MRGRSTLPCSLSKDVRHDLDGAVRAYRENLADEALPGLCRWSSSLLLFFTSSPVLLRTEIDLSVMARLYLSMIIHFLAEICVCAASRPPRILIFTRCTIKRTLIYMRIPKSPPCKCKEHLPGCSKFVGSTSTLMKENQFAPAARAPRSQEGLPARTS